MEQYTGYVPFSVASVTEPCRLWYMTVGNVGSGCPLITISGGPGVSHDYLSNLKDLAKPGRPVVFWDQLGTGRSTHLPEKLFDDTFWTEDLFLEQLKVLLAHLRIEHDYDILGHSWGGMLGTAFASTQPAGLRRLVLSSVPFSSELWLKAYRGYRGGMPEHHRDTLMERRTSLESTSEPRYVAALNLFLSRHFCSLDPLPDELQISQNSVVSDPTVWLSM